MKTEDEKVLLVAEDDKEMRSLLCDELRDLGCRIVEAGDGNEAIERAREMSPSLVLTDLRMPGGGLGLTAKAIREYLSNVGILESPKKRT